MISAALMCVKCVLTRAGRDNDAPARWSRLLSAPRGGYFVEPVGAALRIAEIRQPAATRFTISVVQS